MSAAVAGLRSIRPTRSYTNTRDVTRRDLDDAIRLAGAASLFGLGVDAGIAPALDLALLTAVLDQRRTQRDEVPPAEVQLWLGVRAISEAGVVLAREPQEMSRRAERWRGQQLLTARHQATLHDTAEWMERVAQGGGHMPPDG